MTPSAYLDPRRDERLLEALEAHERVVWAARPVPRLVIRLYRPLPFLGAIVGGFGAFWVFATASNFGQLATNPAGVIMGVLLPLLGLPLAASGVVLIAAPWWMGWRSRQALYAVTDRRCLIWQAQWRTMHVEAFGTEDLGGMRNHAWRDGHGDLTLRREVRISGKGQRRSSRTIEYGFIGIPDVREVESLVRDTLGVPTPART